LKLVRPEADCFLPSPPRPIELMSPELPDWVLFFGTDNIPPPNETKNIQQSNQSTTIIDCTVFLKGGIGFFEKIAFFEGVY
jgi:hypothetical protein